MYQEFPFIAASPDGIIRNLQGNNISIIEIKCPYKAKSFTETDFQVDARLSASKKVLKFLKWKNNSLIINETHDYYYQIQATLFIVNVQHAELLVYASESDTLIIIQVPRNEEFLKKIMIKGSIRYFRFYLPEISTNRKFNNCPPYIFSDDFFEKDIKPRFSFLASANVLNSLKKQYDSVKCVKNDLDFLMAGKLSHIIPLQSIAKTVESFSLRKVSARGDGHCILHSFEINTGIQQNEIKDKLVEEYLGQPQLYSNFNVTLEELNLYINLNIH